MAQGIAVPIKTSNGRFVLLGGDDYIELLVAIGLGEGESENPFQDIALGEFMIFGINDEMSDGEIRERVIRIFDLLEADQLAKLGDQRTALVFETNRGPLGVEKNLTLSYINIETQERREIEVPIPPAE